MLSLFFHATVGKEDQLEASSLHDNVPYTATASVTQEGGHSKIKVVIRYANFVVQYLTGFLQAKSTIIVGSQGEDEDESTHENRFIWTCASDELMRLRPLPPYMVPNKYDEGEEPNKSRAMFDYAIRAVIFQNRKKSWSWSYFKERRDNRVRFLHFLTERKMDYNAYSSEPEVVHQILRSVTNIDAQFCYTEYSKNFSDPPKHF
jgi:hypothetical protein